uniref:Transposable element protein, putative n=2 Tax=Oryza sativa subsp. japonica TaxID=39947 RepID=Q2RA10_ORYSJ|nr:Transposable element protein, putative [Oryza sativa Japonica Group]ABA91622.1 hypothetical protein LOC_Os11g06940 [Oryza sativa Japonica Group]
MADLNESTTDAAALKKLYTEGAIPPKQTMAWEAGEFLLLILNFYGLSLLHLNPNSFAFLTIFAHLCEAYIRVVPFLDSHLSPSATMHAYMSLLAVIVPSVLVGLVYMISISRYDVEYILEPIFMIHLVPTKYHLIPSRYHPILSKYHHGTLEVPFGTLKVLPMVLEVS